jgi:hypothetical protein
MTGSMDPYNRGPRSPRNRKCPTDGSGTEDGARSPTNDQVRFTAKLSETFCIGLMISNSDINFITDNTQIS